MAQPGQKIANMTCFGRLLGIWATYKKVMDTIMTAAMDYFTIPLYTEDQHGGSIPSRLKFATRRNGTGENSNKFLYYCLFITRRK